MNVYPYDIYKGESGIFFEKYLPKKAVYQGELYRVLTEGFKKEKIIKHFSNSKNKERIYYLVKKHYTILKNFQEILDIFNEDEYEEIFYGYSMYEVDGVFYNKDAENKSQEIAEERTQIIRLMFKPNLDTFKKLEYRKMVTITKTFLQCPISTKDYASHYPPIKDIIEKEDDDETRNAYESLLIYLDKWVKKVIIFTAGYIIFSY